MGSGVFRAVALFLAAYANPLLAREFDNGVNSTYANPILPGFHPDPSCIFLPDWDETFFCATSSFNAFPGIPIHASKDLQNWKLIGIQDFPCLSNLMFSD